MNVFGFTASFQRKDAKLQRRKENFFMPTASPGAAAAAGSSFRLRATARLLG